MYLCQKKEMGKTLMEQGGAKIFYLDTETNAAITKLAKKQKISRSQVVRVAITKMVELNAKI